MNEKKDNASTYAFFLYPPSADFLDFLRGELELTITYLTLAELRRRPILSLPRYLRSLNIRTLYLPLEYNSDKALLPLLAILALFSGAGSITVINARKSQFSLGLWKTFFLFSSLIIASLLGQAAYLYCAAELKFLNFCNRIPFFTRPPKDKEKILYIMAGLWTGARTGGAIAHVAGVINALSRAGKSITYLATGKPVMLSSAVMTQEIPPLDTYALPSELNLYRQNLHFARHVKKNSENENLSFIYARMALGNYVCVRLSRTLKTPLVLEYNGSEVWIARHWGNRLRYEALATAAEEACLRHAHLIVTVSEHLKRELIGRGVSPDRIVFHPNGVDPDVFDPERFSMEEINSLRSQYDIGASEIVFGFVGTFGRWHGADILAEALCYISKNFRPWLEKSNLRLVFVGDGLMRKNVERILKQGDCAAHCVLTGLVAQDKAALYMAMCDVLVSPHVPNTEGSPFFGSPTKLFEYLAAGKPLIASDLEQIGDVLAGCPSINNIEHFHRTLENDDAAILTEPGNVENLAKAIRYAVDNPQWRARACVAARKKALSKHTWDMHVDSILSSFKNLRENP